MTLKLSKKPRTKNKFKKLMCLVLLGSMAVSSLAGNSVCEAMFNYNNYYGYKNFENSFSNIELLRENVMTARVNSGEQTLREIMSNKNTKKDLLNAFSGYCSIFPEKIFFYDDESKYLYNTSTGKILDLSNIKMTYTWSGVWPCYSYYVTLKNCPLNRKDADDLAVMYKIIHLLSNNEINGDNIRGLYINGSDEINEDDYLSLDVNYENQIVNENQIGNFEDQIAVSKPNYLSDNAVAFEVTTGDLQDIFNSKNKTIQLANTLKRKLTGDFSNGLKILLLNQKQMYLITYKKSKALVIDLSDVTVESKPISGFFSTTYDITLEFPKICNLSMVNPNDAKIVYEIIMKKVGIKANSVNNLCLDYALEDKKILYVEGKEGTQEIEDLEQDDIMQNIQENTKPGDFINENIVQNDGVQSNIQEKKYLPADNLFDENGLFVTKNNKNNKFDINICDLTPDNEYKRDNVEQLIKDKFNIDKEDINSIDEFHCTKDDCSNFYNIYENKDEYEPVSTVVKRIQNDVADRDNPYENAFDIFLSVEEWYCELKKVVLIENSEKVKKEYSIQLKKTMRNGEIIKLKNISFRIYIEHPFIRLDWDGNKCNIIYYFTSETYKEGSSYARHPSGLVLQAGNDIKTNPTVCKGLGLNGGDFIIKYAEKMPQEMNNRIINDTRSRAERQLRNKRKIDALKSIGVFYDENLDKKHSDNYYKAIEFTDDVEETTHEETFENKDEIRVNDLKERRQVEVDKIIAKMNSCVDVINSNVKFYQAFEDGTLWFNWNNQYIAVQFKGDDSEADAIKAISNYNNNNNSYPVELVVYKDDETKNDEKYEKHKNEPGVIVKVINVRIPSEYEGTYYPYIIGYRGDYGLEDRPELPIIFPIPVFKAKRKYSVVFANQYNGNMNDRFKFNVEFN